MPGLVTDFCAATQKLLADGSWSPHSIAALALWWVCNVHPFLDGNGRTGRALAFLLLIASSELPPSASLKTFHAPFHEPELRREAEVRCRGAASRLREAAAAGRPR